MSRSSKLGARVCGLFVYPDPNKTHWQRYGKLYWFVVGAVAWVLTAWTAIAYS